MIEIPIEDLPLLPIKDPDSEWMAGVFNPGIVVYYLQPDKAVLIDWNDIAELGLSFGKNKPTSAKTDNCRKIPGPTKA